MKDRSAQAAKDAAERRAVLAATAATASAPSFPQGRLTDHRINLTLYKLLTIMEGDLTTVTALQVRGMSATQRAETANNGG
jgi:peptide chain release factor 1